MAVKQQGQEKMTVQSEVGPGDVTGVYHITICNLPFQASWQQLKDWLRPHCEVDYIELFRGSTSGWVRIQGKDNFDRAWARLDGGVFQGRSIIASDKNRTEAIKIREVLDSGVSCEHAGSSDRSMTQTASAAVHFRDPEKSGMQYTSSAVPDLGPSVGSPTMVDNESTPSYMASSTVTTGPTPGILFQMANPTPQPQSQGIQSQDSHDAAAFRRARALIQAQIDAVRGGNIEQMHATSAQSEQIQAMPVQDNGYGDFQILLQCIPRRYQVREICDWVSSKLGSLGDYFVGIELPTNITGVVNHGHATLRFESGTQRSLVIEKLHHGVFHGRKLSAFPLTCQYIHRRGNFTTSSVAPHVNEYPLGLSGGISSDTSSSPLPSMLPNNGPLVVGGSTHRYPTGPGH